MNQEILDMIWKYEYYGGGFSKLNGVEILVKNVKIRKREKMVYADITIHYIEDRKKEIIKDCKYPFKLFEENLKNEK